jgi:hypothetical protein
LKEELSAKANECAKQVAVLETAIIKTDNELKSSQSSLKELIQKVTAAA